MTECLKPKLKIKLLAAQAGHMAGLKNLFSGILFLILPLAALQAQSNIFILSVPDKNIFTDSFDFVINHQGSRPLWIDVEIGVSSDTQIIKKEIKAVKLKPGQNLIRYAIAPSNLVLKNPHFADYLNYFNCFPPDKYLITYNIYDKRSGLQKFSKKIQFSIPFFVSSNISKIIDDSSKKTTQIVLFWKSDPDSFPDPDVNFSLKLYQADDPDLMIESWPGLSDTFVVIQNAHKSLKNSKKYIAELGIYWKGIEIGNPNRFKFRYFKRTKFYLTETDTSIVNLKKKYNSLYKNPLTSKLNDSIRGHVTDSNLLKLNSLSHYFTLQDPAYHFSGMDSFNHLFDSNQPFIKFSSLITSEFQYSTREYNSEFLPPSYYRCHIQPKIAIKGIPFTGSIFLSTENSADYDINNFNLNFDTETYLKNVKLAGKNKINKVKGDLTSLKINSDIIDQKIAEIEQNISQDKLQLKKLDFSNISKQIPDTINQNLDTWKDIKRPDMSEWQNPGYIPDDSLAVLKHLKDSSQYMSLKMQELKQSAFDSIQNIRNQINSRIEKKEDIIDSLDMIKGRIKILMQSLRSSDSILSLRYQNLDFLRDSFDNLGIRSRYLKILSSIESFSIGSVIPYYSDLTLNGTVIDGINLEYYLGKVYVATTAGKIDQKTGFYDQGRINSRGSLLGARLGVGRKDGNHIFFSFLYGNRDDQKIVFNDSLSSSTESMDYSLIGLHFKYLLGSKLELEGEINKSAPNNSSKPGNDLFYLQDYYGRAYALKAIYKIDLTASRIEGFVQQTGPQYASPGVNFVRKDHKTYGYNIQQRLFGNKIVLNGFYKKQIDNYSELIDDQSDFTSLGINGVISFKKWPQISFVYTPYYFSNNYLRENDTLLSVAKNAITSVNLTYEKSFGKVQTTTFSSFSQFSVYNFTENRQYEYQNISFGEQLKLNQQLSLASSLNYVIPQSDADTTESLFVNIEGSFLVLKKMKNLVGMNFIADHFNKNNYGFYWQIEFPVSHHSVFRLRAEKVENRLFYSNLNELQYKHVYEDEFIVNGSWIVHF